MGQVQSGPMAGRTCWSPVAPEGSATALGLVGRSAARILGAGRTRIGPSIGLGLLLFFGLPILAVIALARPQRPPEPPPQRRADSGCRSSLRPLGGRSGQAVIGSAGS